ncbi:hypothetical protein P7K49_007428 [Saguinus oedipus]|uniref:Solute carrier family 22 member 23 n=1 Tax=Saguinus oedipus TaxID=9490 RepID=A0ABQ9VUV7_SAGOE|nr:hypothetical protein P7K49_007428 [Saguinus oedipus]
MAIDRRREAAGGGPGRQPAPAEENGSLPPGDAAASAPLGGRAGLGGGAEIQPLPPLHPGGGPHPSCCSAAAAPSLLLLDYDGSVLPFLGGLGGGYQKTLVLLTWIPALFIGFSQFSDSFLLDQPNFWCRGAGKGTELAGVTTSGRWGDVGNWTSLPTTPFSTAPWEAAGNRSNSSGADGGDTPPLPSPPDKGDNASNCDCHAWDYGIRAGLVQNVVSKTEVQAPGSWRPESPQSGGARLCVRAFRIGFVSFRPPNHKSLLGLKGSTTAFPSLHPNSCPNTRMESAPFPPPSGPEVLPSPDQDCQTPYVDFLGVVH